MVAPAFDVRDRAGAPSGPGMPLLADRRETPPQATSFRRRSHSRAVLAPPRVHTRAPFVWKRRPSDEADDRIALAAARTWIARVVDGRLLLEVFER